MADKITHRVTLNLDKGLWQKLQKAMAKDGFTSFAEFTRTLYVAHLKKED